MAGKYTLNSMNKDVDLVAVGTLIVLTGLMMLVI